MATFSVRPCRPEDESEAREVDVLATADLRRAYRPTQAALARRASLRAALTRLVALADTRVVGVVDYWKDGDRLAFLGLGVHPDFRRRGVARALVRDLERIGSDSGCQALGLHTVRQTGNVRIFERLGFHVESEARTTLFESDVFSELSEVAMVKRIATGKHGED